MTLVLLVHLVQRFFMTKFDNKVFEPKKIYIYTKKKLLLLFQTYHSCNVHNKDGALKPLGRTYYTTLTTRKILTE